MFKICFTDDESVVVKKRDEQCVTPITSPVGTQTPVALSQGTPRKAKYQKRIKALRNKITRLEENIANLQSTSSNIDDSKEMFF